MARSDLAGRAAASATPQTVDDVIKASFGRRLAVLGPLENADLVGTDLTLAIHDTVLPAIDSRPGPSPYLQKLVAEGKLGFKSGEGFRKWSPEEQAALRTRVMQHLKAMLGQPERRHGEPVIARNACSIVAVPALATSRRGVVSARILP